MREYLIGALLGAAALLVTVIVAGLAYYAALGAGMCGGEANEVAVIALFVVFLLLSLFEDVIRDQFRVSNRRQ
jgi:uncharacterized membrane protein